jgi:hypothetical protein
MNRKRYLFGRDYKWGKQLRRLLDKGFTIDQARKIVGGK